MILHKQLVFLIISIFLINELSSQIYSASNNSCGTIPSSSNTGFVTPNPVINSDQVWSFVSEPNLHPMKVDVIVNKPGISSGLIFVAPYAFSQDPIYGQPGSLILDNNANPVWFRPLNSPNLMNTDFRVQSLNGKPVLTFWQGTLATPPAYTNAPGGSSEPGSCYYILDNTYQVIKTVTAQLGFTSDIHEFLLTPQNTALLLSTKTVPMDLTPYGGPQNGFVQDFAVQEIDLTTNQLLFFWNALDNIPLSDSYESASSATRTNNIWDAYHLNSIGLTDDENDILVSGRNTWTIYRINKPTKNIIWRLGGKQSDFIIEQSAKFSWQHDARFFSHDIVTLFDDSCCGSPPALNAQLASRGLILNLDLISMTAAVNKTYYHDPLLLVSSQGNLQSLSNGNKFIGWGQSQYFSEYAQDGNTIDNSALNTLYDAKMPSNNYTYRAYRHEWVGLPFYPPSIGLKLNNCQYTVYASWNGSTETKAWQLFAGQCPNNLVLIKVVPKSGFETAIPTSNCGPFFQVKALNSKNEIIGISKILANSALSLAISQKYCS